MSSDGERDFVVASYDIVDDERRERAAMILEGYGSRVQGSVFELFVDVTTLGEVRRRLEDTIDPLTDRLRLYRLCGKDARDRQCFGAGPVIGDVAYEVF